MHDRVRPGVYDCSDARRWAMLDRGLYSCRDGDFHSGLRTPEWIKNGLRYTEKGWIVSDL